MNKIALSVFILLIISLAACQQAVKKEAGADSMKKTEATAPKAEATGNAAVDGIGNDINGVDAVDKDLNSNQLSDLGSGLADIQNI